MQTFSCISLIGMPGAGKSTIGVLLAEALGYSFMDTDYLLEAIYARRLQAVTEALSRREFLDAECEMVCTIKASRCVIATGGSVVYMPKAMEHLRKLGPIVHLNLPLETVIERVALNPERGISSGPGQGLKELYQERMELYAKHADGVYDTSLLSARECVSQIIADMEIWGRLSPPPFPND